MCGFVLIPIVIRVDVHRDWSSAWHATFKGMRTAISDTMSDKFLSTFMDTFELSVGPSLGPQAMARSSQGLGHTAAANAHLGGLGASSSNPHLWHSPVASPATLSRHSGSARPSSSVHVTQHGASSSSSSLPLSAAAGAPHSDADTTHTSSRQSLLDSETSASLVDEQVCCSLFRSVMTVGMQTLERHTNQSGAATRASSFMGLGSGCVCTFTMN